MARVLWPLTDGRPVVEVTLTLQVDGRRTVRTLLADTGAGSCESQFELVLEEDDCLLCGGRPRAPVRLGGAYRGEFPVYLLPVQIPALDFSRHVRAVGVPSGLAGLDGIACFRFLNQFWYGNFGDARQFGVEC